LRAPLISAAASLFKNRNHFPQENFLYASSRK
jgi:hypothetical protein